MTIKSNLMELSPSQIIKQYNIYANKSFGQNFLKDQNLCKKILSNIDIKNKIVIEVGPGPIALTREILSLDIKKLIVIEKDKKFENLLQDLQSIFPEKLEVIIGDALDIDISQFGNNITIISNLPYNISTPFLVKCCNIYHNIEQMLLMFQKEVADRILSKKDCKNYGRLSILCQSIFDIKKSLDISAKAFYPPPKIDSTIVYFKNNPIIPADIKIDKLSKITEILFNMRRKKLSSIFKKANISILESNIDFDKRPENLTLDEFFDICRKY